MIAKLKGIIDSLESGFVVMDVNGVGYLVFASPRTLSRIGGKGEATSLLIDTHVREDHIHLYGFCDAAERDWFRMLTTVQGVGAKAALSILGVTPPEQLPVAIASQDKAALTRADGVGPKLATRILTELKDKAGDYALGSVAHDKEKPAKQAVGNKKVQPENDNAGIAPNLEVSNDAVSALINLGYGRSEAYGVVARVMQESGNDTGLDELIRLSLKELSS